MQHNPLHHLRRNAVAYLALFVALGGTSFAAATVITGKNVKDSSLTGADVKKGSLTGSDVKNKSLAPADFSGSVHRTRRAIPGRRAYPGFPVPTERTGRTALTAPTASEGRATRRASPPRGSL